MQYLMFGSYPDLRCVGRVITIHVATIARCKIRKVHLTRQKRLTQQPAPTARISSLRRAFQVRESIAQRKA